MRQADPNDGGAYLGRLREHRREIEQSEPASAAEPQESGP